MAAPAPLIRDFRFSEGDFPVSAAGDYLTIEDEDALWQWSWICLATTPGEYRHNPRFGAGVPLFLKKPDTPTNRAELARRIRDALTLHRRVTSVDGVTFATVTLDNGQPALRVAVAVTFDGRIQRGRSFTFRKV